MELDSTENLLDLGVELLGSSLQEILLGMLSELVLASLIFNLRRPMGMRGGCDYDMDRDNGNEGVVTMIGSRL